MEQQIQLNDHNKQEYPPMHTCEHIINRTMMNLFGCGLSVSAHIERKKSKLDYALESAPTEDDVRRLEEAVNIVIAQGLDVTTEFITQEEAQSNTAGDFALDEETGEVQLVRDQANAIIGGLIADKTVKYTKNDKIMAFLNVEDLIGNVEVVVFPQVYERYSTLLVEDAKVFIRGRVSLEEDKDGKLICDQIISFEDAQAARAANQPLFPRNYGGRGGSSRGGSYGNGSGNGGAGGYRNAGNGYGQYQNDGMNSSSMSVGQTGQAAGQMQPGQRTQANGTPQKKGMPAGAWIQFPNMEAYKTREQELLQAIADSDGDDDVVIYLRDIKNIKILPQNLRVKADGALMEKLTLLFGKENVKFITKPIENRSKID